jgi:hypothetical protein
MTCPDPPDRRVRGTVLAGDTGKAHLTIDQLGTNNRVRLVRR